MKYLKNFNESLSNESEIKKLCDEYGIINYTINEDGSIDVDGDVDLSSKGLTKLPIKFNKVYGYFDCSSNKLTSLINSPNYISGYFSCSSNKLTSLKDCPVHINDDFYCAFNQLKNINYLPKYYKSINIINNPIDIILKLFLESSIEFYGGLGKSNSNKELIYDFNDREIIQNDILYIDRLADFLDDIDKHETIQYLRNLLKNDYEIR